MSKNNFILHHDTLSVIEELTDEQAGKLIKEIYAYSLHLNNPEKAKKPNGLIGLLNSVAHPFKKQLDRDLEAYDKRVEINSKNGKKGGRPPIGKNPTKAKKADSDKDSDKEKDIKEKKEQKKESLIVEDKSPTVIVKKPEFNDFHFSVANSLGDFLKERYNKNIPESHIKTWAKDIRLLMERDICNRSDPKSDVITAMQAVLDKTGEPYFPEVQSGSSFRTKFTKIEQNLKRGNYGNSNKRSTIDDQFDALMQKVDAGQYAAM